jgi:hypothetical protein
MLYNSGTEVVESGVKCGKVVASELKNLLFPQKSPAKDPKLRKEALANAVR